MRTINQAAARSGWSREIIEAVIDGLNSRDQLPEVYEHGAAAGYGNFIYYADTVKFSETHRAEIVAKLKDLADDLGEDTVSTMAGFSCLSTWDADDTKRELRDAIGFFLYSTAPESENEQVNDFAVNVFNAAAWFALEEVARAMVE